MCARLATGTRRRHFDPSLIAPRHLTRSLRSPRPPAFLRLSPSAFVHATLEAARSHPFSRAWTPIRPTATTPRNGMPPPAEDLRARQLQPTTAGQVRMPLPPDAWPARMLPPTEAMMCRLLATGTRRRYSHPPLKTPSHLACALCSPRPPASLRSIRWAFAHATLDSARSQPLSMAWTQLRPTATAPRIGTTPPAEVLRARLLQPATALLARMPPPAEARRPRMPPPAKARRARQLQPATALLARMPPSAEVRQARMSPLAEALMCRRLATGTHQRYSHSSLKIPRHLTCTRPSRQPPAFLRSSPAAFARAKTESTQLQPLPGAWTWVRPTAAVAWSALLSWLPLRVCSCQPPRRPRQHRGELSRPHGGSSLPRAARSESPLLRTLRSLRPLQQRPTPWSGHALAVRARLPFDQHGRQRLRHSCGRVPLNADGRQHLPLPGSRASPLPHRPCGRHSYAVLLEVQNERSPHPTIQTAQAQPPESVRHHE